MISVVIADDQALVRMGLRVLIEDEADVDLVGEAQDGRQALDVVRATRPDVVLLDVLMPVMDGLEALRAIVSDPELSGTRVAMLTTFEVDEYIFKALRWGASGFLIKDTEPADLLKAIRVIARGESLLSPTVTKKIISEFVNRQRPSGQWRPDARELVGQLTLRERETVALVAKGLSNSEIAERMKVSPATARTHVSRSMVKLNVRDRAQLVVYAYEFGLVE